MKQLEFDLVTQNGQRVLSDIASAINCKLLVLFDDSDRIMLQTDKLIFAVKAAKDAAAKSVSPKRKVGAAVTDYEGNVMSVGHNKPKTGTSFTLLPNGKEDAVHAEVDALADLKGPFGRYGYLIVTHDPCEACIHEAKVVGIRAIFISNEFLKFDSDKLRYDLVPPHSIKLLAEVLTKGAKKYKPNNWQNNKELWRYEAAMMRHFEAYRAGEYNDKETGLPHLAHAITNLVFLLELTSNEALLNQQKQA